MIYEVYKKLKKTHGEEKALEAFAQMSRTGIISSDEATALMAAETSLAKGLAMADSLIYSTARTFGADLITSDPHLKGLAGVIFIE